MNLTVYYSKMNNTPNSVSVAEIKALGHIFGDDNIQFHQGGAYKPDKLDNAQVVVVTAHGDGYVGRGVFEEITRALSQTKPVFQFDPSGFLKVVGAKPYNQSDYYTKYGFLSFEMIDNSERYYNYEDIYEAADDYYYDRKPEKDEFEEEEVDDISNAGDNEEYDMRKDWEGNEPNLLY